MDGAWLAAAHFAAAALMLILAALMLWIDAASRVIWSFVAVLVLRAGMIGSQAVAFVGDASTRVALSNAVPYYEIALVGAILWFLSIFPKRRSTIWRGAILIAIATAAGIWAFARCIVLCDALYPGPLFLLYTPSAIVAGVAAAILSVSTRSMPEGTSRTSARIVAAALALEAALSAGITLGFPNAFARTWTVAAAMAGAVALGIVLRGRARLGILLGLGLAAASGVIGGRVLGNERFLLYGAWRLAVPVLIGFAVARHRLFDLDIKVKLAARSATIGAVFAGVFFVVTEGGAYALGSRFGMLAGIIAVGALVPLLGPLRRAAERMTRFLPGEEGAPRELTLERRRQIYHDFALQAWADGVLARPEREFLDQLRERLALPAEDAMLLESEASRSRITRNG